MIRNATEFASWEKQYRQKERLDYPHNLRIYESLYLEARKLGVFPLKDPLEGLPLKIRLAKALNVSRAS